LPGTLDITNIGDSLLDAKQLRDRLSQAIPEIEKRADAFVKLAEYHRHAMESRRTVEFRGLLAVLALDAYVFAEAEKIVAWLKKLAISATLNPSEVLTTIVWSVFAIYVGTMISIERRNRHDWQRYMTAEMNAWEILDRTRWLAFYGDVIQTGPLIARPNLISWLFGRAWAFWSSVLVAALVACLTMLRVWAV